MSEYYLSKRMISGLSTGWEGILNHVLIDDGQSLEFWFWSYEIAIHELIISTYLRIYSLHKRTMDCYSARQADWIGS